MPDDSPRPGRPPGVTTSTRIKLADISLARQLLLDVIHDRPEAELDPTRVQAASALLIAAATRPELFGLPATEGAPVPGPSLAFFSGAAGGPSPLLAVPDDADEKEQADG